MDAAARQLQFVGEIGQRHAIAVLQRDIRPQEMLPVFPSRVCPLSRPSGDHPAFGGDQRGREKGRRCDEHHHRPCGNAGRERADAHPERAAQRAQNARRDHHHMQPIRPKSGRRGRGNQHRGDENDPHGLEPDHDAEHDQPHQQEIDRARGKPQRAEKFRVENEALKLFVKRADRNEHQRGHHAHRVQIRAHDRSRLPKEKFVQPALIAHRALLDMREQHDADPEKDRKHDAQRRVGFDARVVDDDLDDEHAQDAGRGRPQQQDGQRLALRPQKRQGHARKRGVGQGIAQQAPPTQHGKRAQRARSRAEQQRAEQDELKGRVPNHLIALRGDPQRPARLRKARSTARHRFCSNSLR